MENILLAIKPSFVKEIIDGTKRFEYRKRLPRKDFDKAYIYATRPIKRVVAIAEVWGCRTMEKESLWEETYQYSGISKHFYDSYFRNSRVASAIEFGKITVLEEPILLRDKGIEYPPQSWVYINEEENE